MWPCEVSKVTNRMGLTPSASDSGAPIGVSLQSINDMVDSFWRHAPGRRRTAAYATGVGGQQDAGTGGRPVAIGRSPGRRPGPDARGVQELWRRTAGRG